MEYRETDFGYVMVLDAGDELIRSLIALARREDVSAADLVGLGAVDRVELGYFDLEIDGYQRRTFEETLEVASLTGTLSLLDGEPFPHVHGVFARTDFSTVGGHVFEAVCSVTVEVGIHVDPGILSRSPVDHCSLQAIDLSGE